MLSSNFWARASFLIPALFLSHGCAPSIRTASVVVPSNFTYPLDSGNFPITQDVANSYQFQSSWSDGSSRPLICTYQTLGLSTNDPNYAAQGTSCTSLPSLATGSQNSAVYLSSAKFANGVLSWLPTSTQRGTYAFTIQGTLGSQLKSGTFYISVREPYNTIASNMVGGFDGTQTEGTTGLSQIPSIPRTTLGLNNDRSSWTTIIGSTSASLASFGTAAPWVGNGSTSSPYALTFTSGNQDFMTIGNVMSSQTGEGFSAWISPSSATTGGSIILGNANGAGKGFLLRQSTGSPGKIEFLNDSGTVCQSTSVLNNGSWYFVSGQTYGTSSVMYINGQSVCSVASTSFSPSSTNFTVGANISGASNWAGSIADLKLYGTTNATAPLSSAFIQTDFNSSANRFRTTPIEDIVTNGLVLNVDPANANQGLSPFANGCTASELSYFLLSSTGIVQNSSLNGFSSPCTTDGWLGSGTVTDPYRLTFNGTTDTVRVGSFTVDNTSMTASLWLNTTVSADEWAYNQNAGFLLTSSVGGDIRAILGGNSIFGPTVIDDGLWHYLTLVLTSSAMTVYVDGNAPLVATGTFSGSTSGFIFLGSLNGSSHFFTGSIGPTMLWNVPLTAAQVKQNCLAQEHRFTSTPNSICGLP